VFSQCFVATGNGAIEFGSATRRQRRADFLAKSFKFAEQPGRAFVLASGAGKLESLLQSSDGITFGFHLTDKVHRFSKSSLGSFVFALKPVQMGDLAQSQRDSVFASRLAKNVEAFLEKFFCRPESAFADRRASELQGDPGVGFPKGPKDQERFLEETAGVGEFLSVDRYFAQFIQTPRFAYRCVHLLKGLLRLLKFDSRLSVLPVCLSDLTEFKAIPSRIMFLSSLAMNFQSSLQQRAG